MATAKKINVLTAEKSGFVCPGNCLTCKKCFKAQAGDAIIFPLH